MSERKAKRFGGIEVSFDPMWPLYISPRKDGFGFFTTLSIAKRIHGHLGKAIAYVEKAKRKPQDTRRRS